MTTISKYTSSEEFVEAYCSNVFKNIRNIMDEKGISPKTLARKIGLAQSTVSKFLTGDTKGSLNQIAKICWALNIEPSDVFSANQDVLQNTLNLDKILTDSNMISTNPAQSPAAFKGYLREFKVYFTPTISSENNILQGSLTFKESTELDSCTADLALYTGRKRPDGSDIIKHYTGTLVISLSMSACYCTLISKELGEICFLVFSHMFLFNEDLICRMACVSTVSSGGNRRPTMHRLLICREELDLDISDPESDDFKFIRGQLMLNSSDIFITKESYEKMTKAESNILSSPDMKKLMAEFDGLCSKGQVYHIDESKLRNAPYATDIKLCFLSLLRQYSIAERYNKISTKTDEYIYDYIESRKMI